jgi:phenylalanyl-tRNA synthetase beta chain
VLAALISGMVSSQEWYQAAREVDFFDIKGIAEDILEVLGIEEPEFKRNGPKEGLDPDEYARIFCSASEIGSIGKVSRNTMEGCGLQRDAYLLGLDIEALSPFVKSVREFKPLAKFPSVRRDISIVVNRYIETATLLDIVKGMGKELIESVNVFDVYQGKVIGKNEKALAIRIDYRSRDRTLTDDEVNRIHEGIIEEIRRHTGGRLREGPRNGNPG